MRIRVVTIWLVLAALLVSSPVRADQHIAGAAAQQQAMEQKTASDAAARATVIGAMHRADVQALAAKMGVDLKSAESAVRTLPADQVTDAAASLLNADPDLAGGNNTVTISVTTLLLIIIIILLVAN